MGQTRCVLHERTGSNVHELQAMSTLQKLAEAADLSILL